MKTLLKAYLLYLLIAPFTIWRKCLFSLVWSRKNKKTKTKNIYFALPFCQTCIKYFSVIYYYCHYYYYFFKQGLKFHNSTDGQFHLPSITLIKKAAFANKPLVKITCLLQWFLMFLDKCVVLYIWSSTFWYFNFVCKRLVNKLFAIIISILRSMCLA